MKKMQGAKQAIFTIEWNTEKAQKKLTKINNGPRNND